MNAQGIGLVRSHLDVGRPYGPRPVRAPAPTARVCFGRFELDEDVMVARGNRIIAAGS